MERANSEEFDALTSDRVVIFMPEVWNYCNLNISFTCIVHAYDCIYFDSLINLLKSTGFNNTHGKYDEIRIPEDITSDPWLYYR